MWTIFRLNLIYYINNIEEVIYLSSFFVIVNVINYFNSPHNNIEFIQLNQNSLLIGLFFICIQCSSGIYQRDAEAGILELYCQLSISKYLIVIAKLLASFAAVILAILIALPIISLIANQSLITIPHTLLGLGVAGLAILILGNLAAVITVGIARGRAMLLLLVFPLMLPILIFAGEYLQHPETLWQPSLTFMLAYSAFLLPILCLAGSASIRNN